jgi:hypothetical protein
MPRHRHKPVMSSNRESLFGMSQEVDNLGPQIFCTCTFNHRRPILQTLWQGQHTIGNDERSRYKSFKEPIMILPFVTLRHDYDFGM